MINFSIIFRIAPATVAAAAEAAPAKKEEKKEEPEEESDEDMGFGKWRPFLPTKSNYQTKLFHSTSIYIMFITELFNDYSSMY